MNFTSGNFFNFVLLLLCINAKSEENSVQFEYHLAEKGICYILNDSVNTIMFPALTASKDDTHHSIHIR